MTIPELLLRALQSGRVPSFVQLVVTVRKDDEDDDEMMTMTMLMLTMTKTMLKCEMRRQRFTQRSEEVGDLAERDLVPLHILVTQTDPKHVQ